MIIELLYVTISQAFPNKTLQTDGANHMMHLKYKVGVNRLYSLFYASKALLIVDHWITGQPGIILHAFLFVYLI